VLLRLKATWAGRPACTGRAAHGHAAGAGRQPTPQPVHWAHVAPAPDRGRRRPSARRRGDDAAQGEGSSPAMSRQRRHDEVDDRLWRRSDMRGSVVTYVGRRRRGERRRKGVGVAAGGTTTLPMEGGARPGGDSSSRLDTRGFRHRQSKRHGLAATSGGKAQSGGVACSDTCGRERGAASNRLSGRAAGQCFMAWAQAWQRCCGSRRQLEMEHQRVGPSAESGDRQVGPWFEIFPK
jgi:hypothetical protein